MATKTTNYNLHKIDLTDAPPDITVLNPNFDTIDSELKNLNDTITTKTSEIAKNVSDNYTTKDEFNALEIGGRNLIKNTSKELRTSVSFIGWNYWESESRLLSDINVSAGDKLTLQACISSATRATGLNVYFTTRSNWSIFRT